MRLGPLVVLALLAPLVVSAGAASAQRDGAPAWSFSVDPSALELPAGRNASISLVISNPTDRGITVLLSHAEDSAVAQVRLAQSSARVGPGQSLAVRANVLAPLDAPRGVHDIAFFAKDGAAMQTSSDAGGAQAILTLRVVDPPRPPGSPDSPMHPPAPAITPGRVEIVAGENESKTFSVRVENVGEVDRRFEIRFDLPAGWTGKVDSPLFALAAGASREIQVTITPGEGAFSSRGRVLVVAPDSGAAGVELVLHSVRGTEDPAAPTPARPLPESQPAPVLAGRPVALEVIPRLVHIEAGGTATAFVVVSNGGLEPMRVVLDVQWPAFFRATVTPPFVDVPAGGEVRARIDIHASPDAPLEIISEARIFSGGGRLPAILRILVEAPVPPVDLVAVSSGVSQNDGAVVAAVAVAGVGTSLAALGLVRRRWPWLLAALYTRLAPSKMLDHPLRERLVAEIRADPGVTFGELARRTGAAAGMLTHHARMLEQARLVFSSPDGQLRRFYPIAQGRVAPTIDLAERARVSLRAEGPATLADLARRLDVSRQALHYHVKKMQSRGELTPGPDGALRLRVEFALTHRP